MAPPPSHPRLSIDTNHSCAAASFFPSISGRDNASSPHHNLDGITIDTSRAKSNMPVVSLCARKLGMVEYREGRNDGLSCDIYWHNIVYNDIKAVVTSGGAEARVNKFPGMTELAKKIALTRAIRSMRELYPDEYQFYPRSWVMPAQLDDFRQHTQHSPGGCYIAKPDDGAQGSGIYLFSSADELQHGATTKQLVQEYIADPYLLKDGLKFDFRVYAVIKNINPLSIFVAREGMARFCTEKYVEPTPANFSNVHTHLTNYSLNKIHDSYVHSNSLRDQLKGSKRLLSTVFHQMELQGVRTRQLWHDIKMIVVKTTIAMLPEMMLSYEQTFINGPGPQCFQIMGFDIMVRRDGVPILLEVNSAPSLSVDHNNREASMEGGSDIPLPVRSIVDEMIKVPLVRDTLLLVMDRLEPLPRKGSARTVGSQQTSDTAEDNRSAMNTALLPRKSEDDIGVIRRMKKPHLSEIFPGRYGQNSRHLLVLDRAVYLFMQFVNIRLTLHISLPAFKAFLRKCSLADLMSVDEVEKKFASINFYFTGQQFDYTSGLPFHGFLQYLFHLANAKFHYSEGGTLAALLRLLAYCDSSLRHFGVRSTRLRRAEREVDENNLNVVQIYLLPNRMRHYNSPGGGEVKAHPPPAVGAATKRKAANAAPRQHIARSRSVPRDIGGGGGGGGSKNTGVTAQKAQQPPSLLRQPMPIRAAVR